MHKAFTLIELLIVVLIIGILAAIALPQYQKAVEKSRAIQAIAIVKSIADAQEVYYMENGSYATDLSDLSVEIPGEDYEYEGATRKKLIPFSFSAYAPYDAGAVAVSSRWNKNFSAAHYTIVRFGKDTNFYCRAGAAVDTYQTCLRLSSGKTITKNGTTYYIIP